MIKTKMGKDGMYDLLPVIGFLLILVIIIFGVIYCNIERDNMLNDFCKSKGYNKSTDFHFGSTYFHSVDYDEVLIECDGIMIFKAQKKERCLDFDKWGDCSKEVDVYY